MKYTLLTTFSYFYYYPIETSSFCFIRVCKGRIISLCVVRVTSYPQSLYMYDWWSFKVWEFLKLVMSLTILASVDLVNPLIFSHLLSHSQFYQNKSCTCAPNQTTDKIQCCSIIFWFHYFRYHHVELFPKNLTLDFAKELDELGGGGGGGSCVLWFIFTCIFLRALIFLFYNERAKIFLPLESKLKFLHFEFYLYSCEGNISSSNRYHFSRRPYLLVEHNLQEALLLHRTKLIFQEPLFFH